MTPINALSAGQTRKKGKKDNREDKPRVNIEFGEGG